MLKDKFRFKKLTSMSFQKVLIYRLSIFLILCVVLGGTAQNVLTYKIPLYLVSLILIGHTLMSPSHKSLGSLRRPPIIIGSIFCGLFIMYLIPLPPSIWANIPGREILTHGYNLVDMQLPWLPLSLTPEKTLSSLFSFIPIVAIIMIMKLSASSKEIDISIYALIGVTVFSCFLGVLQTLGRLRDLTLYNIYNVGYPVGLFANINHQACLINLCIPLALYLAFSRNMRNELTVKRFFLLCAVLILSVGAIYTGSIAGYIVFLFSLFTSIYFIFREKIYSRLIIILSLVIFAILLFDGLFFGGQIHEFISKFTSKTQTSRKIIYDTSLIALKQLGIWGAGPGSFLEIYRIYEDRTQLTNIFVNEAHNDFLQIWMELGVFGIMTILLGLGWLFQVIFKGLLNYGNKSSRLLIYSISTLAIIIHSSVDYPLRTISISVIFMYLLLLIDRESKTSDISA